MLILIKLIKPAPAPASAQAANEPRRHPSWQRAAGKSHNTAASNPKAANTIATILQKKFPQEAAIPLPMTSSHIYIIYDTGKKKSIAKLIFFKNGYHTIKKTLF
jgi:hypothetical protein